MANIITENHAQDRWVPPVKPIVIISHPRSGTHLTIDGLRHFFVECVRRQRPRQSVHDLYINLDRLDQAHPFPLSPEKIQHKLTKRSERVLIKTHCTTALEQVDAEYKEFAGDIINASSLVYVVRDPRPVLASYMALRPMKYPDSPTDMSTFLRSSLDCDLQPAAGWAKHVGDWIDTKGICVIRFEDMMADYNSAIGTLGTQLGLARNKKQLIMYPKPKSRRENKTRRLFGRQLCSSIDNLRMNITTPKWRDVMSDDDLALIQEQAGEMMTKLGYEW